MIQRSLVALATAALLTTACEKAGGTDGKPSGALSSSEAALFKYLPASSNLVFGADYEKFMKHWETSPLKAFGESFMARSGAPNGMRDYMTCLVTVAGHSHVAGALGITDGGASLTMVFDGLKVEVLSTCADKGGFKYHKDDDGKYLELEVPDGLGGTARLGYLFVDPTTAFFSFVLPLAGVHPQTLGRADLEARVKQATAASAADSPAIKQLLEQADRSKPFWFAGTTAGTPLADKLGGGSGWMDLDQDSITFAFTVELGDADTATKAVTQFKKLPENLVMLPPDLKGAAEAFLKDSHLESSGKTLKGKFRITNDEVTKAMPALGGLMGAPR